jgi:hypothetical protein
LRDEPRGLIGEFRRLAPARAPVPIQVWSLRRVVLSLGVAVAAAIGIAAVLSYARLAGLL